jgi:hypothetical protein
MIFATPDGHNDGNRVAWTYRELVDCTGRGDAGAEQWGGLHEIKVLRNVIGVRRVTEHVLAVASVDVLAGDLAFMTEMFTSAGAELALLTCPPQRLHADRIANREIGDARTPSSTTRPVTSWPGTIGLMAGTPESTHSPSIM